MKLCKDCKHYWTDLCIIPGYTTGHLWWKKSYPPRTGIIFHFCRAPEIDIVDGHDKNPDGRGRWGAWERRQADCGMDAKLWEAK